MRAMEPESSDSTSHLHTNVTSPSYIPADKDTEFLQREELRSIRIGLELLKPELIQREQGIRSTIVVFGSAQTTRIGRRASMRSTWRKRKLHEPRLIECVRSKVEIARRQLALSKYYDVAREFGRLVSSTCQIDGRCDYVIVTGGGPGIMEAAEPRGSGRERKIHRSQHHPASRTASEPLHHTGAEFSVSLFRHQENALLDPRQGAGRLPGGFGTLDELFETLTLLQTGKTENVMVVLVGRDFWERLINWQLLVEDGLIGQEDLRLFHYAETAQEAWDLISPPQWSALIMKLSFHGAARSVTGSRHMVETPGCRMLLDCGLFQGRREEALRQNQDLGFDPKSIRAVLLSHAHVDHSGALPVLPKHGFSGKVYLTRATADLTDLMLEDSAHVQVSDCSYVNKQEQRKGKACVRSLIQYR